jgi:hypothetical protein
MNSLQLSFILLFMTSSVAFGSDSYQGTRFCDKDTTFQEESAQQEVFRQITPDRADQENAHLQQVPGELLKSDAPKSVASLCQGTTALKTIKTTLIAYDLSFEPGISIDKVTNYRNALKSEYRKLAQSYFAASSRSPQPSRCGNYLFPQFITKKVAFNSGGYFGVELKNLDDLDPADAVQKNKLTKLEVDVGAIRTERAQVLEVKLKGKWTSVLVPAAWMKKVYYNDYDHTFLTKIYYPQFPQSSAYVAVDSQKLRYWEGNDEKAYRLTPLSAVCVGDACALRQAYLFSDLPDSFQKGTLGLKDLLAKDPVSHSWTIASASRDADAIWDAYMNHFTTVKEVQVPDEKLTKYEVELDLEPFCRYALPKKDMLSQ